MDTTTSTVRNILRAVSQHYITVEWLSKHLVFQCLLLLVLIFKALFYSFPHGGKQVHFPSPFLSLMEFPLFLHSYLF